MKERAQGGPAVYHALVAVLRMACWRFLEIGSARRPFLTAI
jgi:hypothetical protein